MKKTLLFILLSTLVVLYSCDEATKPSNNAPIIQSITASPLSVSVNETTSLSCVATDADGDNLTFTWSADNGTFPNGTSGSSVTWKAPSEEGTYKIEVTASDGKLTDQKEKSIIVSINSGDKGNLIGVVYQINTNVVLNGVLVEAGGKSATSAGDGSYRIENIPAGDVTVRATKTDYEVYGQTVTITVNQTTTHDIYMTGSILSTNISGNVWDIITQIPISGVKITIANQVDYTDASGHYQLPNVPQGLHQITAEKEDYVTFEGDVFLSSSPKVFNIELAKIGSTCPGTPTVTYAGKTYNTVLIGNQCWLKENLNVGTMIQGGDDMTDNGSIEKYCYDNNESNCNTYGGLYQWDELMQYVTAEGTQGICPPGWHIPTRAELIILKAAVGSSSNALKAIGQGTGGGAGTNTSGFSGMLAGGVNEAGSFFTLGEDTFIQSSSEHTSTIGIVMRMQNDNDNVYFVGKNKYSGFSIRCLKD